LRLQPYLEPDGREKGWRMLENIALFTGIVGLLLIVFSIAYGLLAAKWKSKAFGWLMGTGVILIIGSWVLFIIPET